MSDSNVNHCVICCCQPAVILSRPCSHQLACTDCFKQMIRVRGGYHRCPLCRAAVTKYFNSISRKNTLVSVLDSENKERFDLEEKKEREEMDEDDVAFSQELTFQELKEEIMRRTDASPAEAKLIVSQYKSIIEGEQEFKPDDEDEDGSASSSSSSSSSSDDDDDDDDGDNDDAYNRREALKAELRDLLD